MASIRSHSLTAFALAQCAAFVAPAQAQTVFNNGNASNTVGYYSDPIQGQFIADTFTFSSTTTFDNIVWFGGYYPNDTFAGLDNFTVTLHNTTGGVPNATAFSTFTVGNTATKTNSGGTFTAFGTQRVFQYSSALPSSVTLGPGTYSLSIVNNTNTTNNSWIWAFSNFTGTAFTRSSTSGNFSAVGGDMAFRLVNTIITAAPEPGSLTLVGVSLVGMLGWVARRKRGTAMFTHGQ